MDCPSSFCCQMSVRLLQTLESMSRDHPIRSIIQSPSNAYSRLFWREDSCLLVQCLPHYQHHEYCYQLYCCYFSHHNCCCDEPLFASMNSAQVWCWRIEHVPPQCRLMQHLDDWSALREYLSYEFHAQNSCLKTFMHMLLRGQPHHDHLQVTPFSIRFSQRSSPCCVGCYVCDGPFCASKHSCRLEFSPVRACYLTLSAGTHCKWQSCGQQAWLIMLLACFAQICTC